MPVISAFSAESFRRYCHPARMVQGLWEHRELLVQLMRREITQRYRGTALGVLWSFLTPLLMLVIYTFVFAVVFQAKWGDDPGLLSKGQPKQLCAGPELCRRLRPGWHLFDLDSI